jgi:hypothetical protein
VGSIGNLTYTPATNYVGADSFKFQVRDAVLYSADATMAITVTPDILVSNGSFETTGAFTDANWAHIASFWNPTPDSAYCQSHAGVFFTNAADGNWYANFTDSGFSITQDLQTIVNAGDILSVTFYIGKDNPTPGVMTATFMVGSTPYSQDFDTSSQAAGTWAPYTLTKTLANAGNLSVKFSSLSGRAWLDRIGNIAVTPTNAPASTNATLTIVEDTATALTAGNFGYADPNSPAGHVRSAKPGDLVELSSSDAPPVPFNCHREIFTFSAHARRDDLLAYAIKVRPKTILLVHGDDPAIDWFKRELYAALPDCKVMAPPPGQPIEL